MGKVKNKKKKTGGGFLGALKVFLMAILIVVMTGACTGVVMYKLGYLPAFADKELPIDLPIVMTDKAQSAFTEYVDLLNKKDYEGMYNMLSSNSKSSISRKDFVERNESIYAAAEASDIKVEYGSGFDFDDSVSFTMTMNTIVGEISFDNAVQYANEDGKYKLVWSDAVMFPDMTEDTKITVVKSLGNRGSIYDRNGVMLAGNGPAEQVGLVPGKMEDDTISRLAAKIGVSKEAIEKKLSASWVTDDSFVPVRTLGQNEDSSLYWPSDEGVSKTVPESELLDIPGVMLRSTTIRIYPLGEAAAHLIGYVAGISAEELEADEDGVYNSGSIVGKSGLELVYEKRLRGDVSLKLSLMNQKGETLRVFGVSNSNPGEDIMLTIDAEMQKSIYEQYKNDESATVAMNQYNGEVLAMVSTPSYDPNHMIFGVSQELWDSWNNDPGNPLQSRFKNTWVPGSTMKTMTSLIGITTGKVNPKTRFKSSKSWRKNSTWGSYRVTTKHVAKPATMNNALIVSDNVYFAKAALKIGQYNMVEAYKSLGFGEEIDFPLPMSVSSYANTKNISSEVLLADSGYGQGEMLVNPLHMAAMYTTLANQGSMLQPILELGTQKTVWKEGVFTQSAVDTVNKSLTKVVSSTKGTGHSAYMTELGLAGKTGTAEIKASKKSKNGQELGWFVCFTTDQSEANSVMICTMVEECQDRDGSEYVVCGTRDIFKKWFERVGAMAQTSLIQPEEDDNDGFDEGDSDEPDETTKAADQTTAAVEGTTTGAAETTAAGTTTAAASDNPARVEDPTQVHGLLE